nr:neurofilament medium polypeptide-like [Rhipicephalus microplus]
MDLNKLRKRDLVLLCQELGIEVATIHRKPLLIQVVKDSGADAEELAECWELIQERMKRAQEVEEREHLMFKRETVRRKEEAESQERNLERLRLQLKIAEIQAGARVSMRDLLQLYKESEEEGPILETDNVRSPSPENDEGASQVSDEEGGLEIVEDGNSSDGEQGEDESNGAKENDDGGDKAGDGDEAEEGGVEEEGEEEKPEVQPQAEEEESLQMNLQEEETGSVPVEDTPASPTEEDSSFMHDAPASPPAEESPSSPLEATPSPATPVDVPASPMEDVVPEASPIESGEDSSAPVSPEEVPADEQSAEVSG